MPEYSIPRDLKRKHRILQASYEAYAKQHPCTLKEYIHQGYIIHTASDNPPASLKEAHLQNVRKNSIAIL